MAETILSVGIDIGTSTTSLVFSNLTFEKVSGDMAMPKTEITEKKIIYRSPVYFTPLKSNTELDAELIRMLIEKEYQTAGIKPSDVETGAVIITGDTARKRNADKVLSSISEFAGDFVVATAGPRLESILAGKGSGAAQYSIDTIETICNMDVGGGTTNTATFYNGSCTDADCMDIGGRLIRLSPGTKTIEYIFPKIKQLALEHGIDIRVGGEITDEQAQKISKIMARAMLEKINPQTKDKNFFFLCTEKDSEHLMLKKPDAISFSGGVGKLVYEAERKNKFVYNDIGVFLADALKKEVEKCDIKLVRPTETISATVIGAGSHSVDVSGGTIAITDANKLPLKNIPIINMHDVLDTPEGEIEANFNRQLRWIQETDATQNVAININVERRMGFKDITALADKIICIAGKLLKIQDTLIIIIYGDYGKVLGQSLEMRLPDGKGVICIDAIDIAGGDYIDIGRPVGVADSVPVVIKTVAFSY